MKKTFPAPLFVLAFFLLFQGCDKERADTDRPGSIPEVQEYRVRDILEGEVLSNAKVSEKLDRFTNVGDKMADKDSNLKKLDLTVIVDRATYVEKDGYGSYTFPVMQHREENIRNVLLSPNGNEGYDAFLIEYPYNLDALADGLSPEQMAESVEVVPLAPGTDPLAGKIHSTWICAYEYIKSYGYVHGSGGNLTGDTGYRWVLHATTCFVAHTYTEDRSTYSSDGNTRTINIDLPGGGGGGGLNTSPVPTIYDEEELLKINVLKKELSTNFPEGKYIDGHPSNAFKLHGFLAENGFSAPAKGFAKAALHALMDGGEVDFDEQIILKKELAKDYPCQAGIVMDASTSCSPLTWLVLDIFEQDNDVNLIFQSSNNISGNGQTSNIIKYNSSDKTCDVQVSFRESYLSSATDLSIARTAIHESLHAVLVYMLFEGKFVTRTGNPGASYEELVDGYIEYLKTNDPTRYGDEQHEVIANLNKDIATSLSAYGNKKGYSLPFSYYETLSWGGLIQTESFKKSYPKYLSDGKLNPEWKTINNTLAAEQNNSSSYQDGNGKTIVPKGKPCK